MESDQDSENQLVDGSDVVEVNEDDLVEVIDLDHQGEEDGSEMEMEGYDGEDEEGAEEEKEEDEARMEDIQDDSDFCFKAHTASVFSCDLDPKTSSLAITGGEDDKAYVWNIADGTTALICTGHSDSVTCVGFSSDSKFVASGDMSGLIKVWSTESWEEIWSFECSDLEWMKWHPSAHVLLAGTADGDIWMWKIPSGECKTMQGHGCQTTTAEIFSDGKQCSAGYEDGVIKVWDLKTAKALTTFKGNSGHQDSVTSLDCHDNNNLILSGSVDGSSKIYNCNTGKEIAVFFAGDVNEDIGETNSVESVGFCHSQPLAAVGSLNGTLSIWDTPTQIIRHKCQHDAGIVKLKWDKSNPLVYSCSLDGMLRLWDARSGKVEGCWSGHTGEILDMTISRDGNTILTVSGDKTARVFPIHVPDR
ncbi:angio-associated migratory cell protein-like isoform X3 [Anneissia japonica]|nr:angio-associated migratory cell protein-like isoform X2 [Anneissia japonica]XP_033101350.1 angio-associated migratory cell protein-like isoform X3 [Anneissia japonica]